MGTLKIELDLPNFERELTIEIKINRDGEVVYSTSPSSNNSNSDVVENKTVTKEEIKPNSITNKKNGGNLMGIEF